MATQPFIGIDFGTCNSSVAWFNPKTRHAELLLNAEGEDKTPSVVSFGPTEVLVGRHAEAGLANREARKRVLSAVKRELARPRVWMLGGRRVTPVEAAAEILKKLKRDAEEGQFHEAVPRAVITCPASFDEIEKDKLREAATLAGFQEVELLEEPVAAAIAYAQAGVQVGRHVLVYDLGGGTFDLALLVRDDGDDTFRLAMEPRGERIGGEDFDRAIYDYFDGLMQQKLNMSVCAEGVDLQFLRECRKCKESLSASERPFPFSWWQPETGNRLELKVNRTRFESLIGGHVERTIELTRSVREEAVAAGFAVDTVILIGGSSRIPLIMRRLHETSQVEPRKWQKQDVAVALGAAYHAQARWGDKTVVAVETPVVAVEPGPSTPATVVAAEHGSQARDLLERARAAFDKGTRLREQSSRKREDREAGLEAMEKALRYAQAACDLEPQWAEAVYLKGLILQKTEEWSLAVAAYTAAIRLAPNSSPAYRDRGDCRLMTGDNVGAKADFDEIIRRKPVEADYRGRALANLRLRDAAAAVSDLQQALSLADRDTPRAALHVVRALLLRDELASPKDALAPFAEALRCLSRADRVELRHFGPTCDLFGVGRRLKADTADDSSFALMAAVQRALWPACKAVHGGCTRAAAAELLARNTQKIDPNLWKNDPDLAFHVACIRAEQKDAASVVVWLDRLLKANPLFNIRLAQQDPFIEKLEDRELRDFLTPRCRCEEQHGLVFNHVTVTNRAPFRITEITVTISIEFSDGTKKKPIIQRLAYLEVGATHRWPNFFKEARLFGSNIHEVDITVDCAERRPPFGGSRRQPPPNSMFELVDKTPRPKEGVVLLEPAEEKPGPTGKERSAPAKGACPRCGFAGRQPWQKCPKCGLVRKTRKS